jgi:hypothetical protein
VTSADVRLASAQTQACSWPATFLLADARRDLWSGNPKTVTVTAVTETNAVKFIASSSHHAFPSTWFIKIEILQNVFHSFLQGEALVCVFVLSNQTRPARPGNSPVFNPQTAHQEVGA